MKGISHGAVARDAMLALLATGMVALVAAGAAAADPGDHGQGWNGGSPHGGPPGPPHRSPVAPVGPPHGSGPHWPQVGPQWTPNPEETELMPGCTSTLTGTINGGVVVPTGQRYCLLGAQVNGGVWVSPGAGVEVQESRVNGGVGAQEANYVRVCDSLVNGPVAARDGIKYVMIGDDGDDGTPGCGSNLVHGPVVLIHNQAGVEVGGDWIAGPLVLAGNEGPAFEGTDVGAEVEGNHIFGPLACTGNSPEPTNDGLPNMVFGPEWGQCKGF
jgi:hypothetical protein